VPPELTDLASELSLTPHAALGIPIALVGAVFLSIGTQFQHAGVAHVDRNSADDATSGLSMKQIVALLGRPSWVIGTLLLGLAIVLQLTSIGLAPLIVVQPLGAIALVITAIVNARVSKVKLDRASIRAIATCVGGIALFVGVAAFFAESHPITETQLAVVLTILAVVLATFGTLFAIFRDRFKPIFYIIGAGVLFGFVATIAKVVIGRIQTLIEMEFHTGSIEWLTIGLVVGLAGAAALGSYFVQTAYSNGPPDLVIAGLTVIDPIVAITIGIVVLGEASGAPLWAMFAFLVAGAIAIWGVFQLSKHHPQTQN